MYVRPLGPESSYETLDFGLLSVIRLTLDEVAFEIYFLIIPPSVCMRAYVLLAMKYSIKENIYETSYIPSCMVVRVWSCCL